MKKYTKKITLIACAFSIIDVFGGCKGDSKDLEARMIETLNSVKTDRSFYLEIRRPDADKRVFTYSRNVDGEFGPESEISSASTAKLISSAVILDVVSNPHHYPGGGELKGRTFNLDAKAIHFLPDGRGGTYWSNQNGDKPSRRNLLRNVTLRDLLSFTSGLELEKAEGRFSTNCIGKDESEFTHGECVRELVSVNLDLNKNRDERSFFYNGAHLHVAALMAVNAAGVSNFAELFEIFKSKHGVLPGAIYNKSEGKSSPNPAGGLRYYAKDYALLLEKLYKGEILSQEIYDEMFSNVLSRVNNRITFSPVTNDGQEWMYGFGVWTECRKKSWDPMCEGENFSSTGSFGSYPFIYRNFEGSTSNTIVGFLGRKGMDKGTGRKGVGIVDALSDKNLIQDWAKLSCRKWR